MTSIEQTYPQMPALNFSASRALPMIYQTESAECGLACLTMVAGFYGLETDIQSVRRTIGGSCHGITLKQLIDMAAKLGLSGRPLRLDLEHLNQLQFPCILHLDMNHFVVAKKVTGSKLIIHDPAVGECLLSEKEIAQRFTGIALELAPNTQFTPGKQRRTLNLKHFWQRIVGLKRTATVVIILSLILQLVAILNPYYMQLVIDDVILRADLNLLMVLALGFGLLLILELGIQWLRQVVVLQWSSRLHLQMASNVFTHLVRLPLDYFVSRHMGDIVSRFGSIRALRDVITSSSVAVFIDGVMAILTLLVMVMYSLSLTVLVLVIVLMYGVVRWAFYRPLLRSSEQALVSAAKENSHFMETVRAMQTVKLYEKETLRQSQWQNRLAEFINCDIQVSRWKIRFDIANKALFGLENILVVYFAAIAVTESLFTVGMLYAFIAYKSRFVSAMDNLITNLIEFKMLRLHFDRLADIVFTSQDPMLGASQKEDVAANDRHNTVSANIEVKNLSYAYSAIDSPVFSEVSFSIPPGCCIAIVGSSGCGKSSLLKCLMGLFEPSHGEILIDGVSLQHRGEFRSRIGAVLQDDQLLAGSIADNIACFDPQPNLQKIVFCANLACIHDEIMSMSMQYNTLVGDMGASLSGGQKQRIMLARALYKEPSILFLDEATSHLDVANEAAINQQIKQLSISRVIVAHRPETIASADRVLKMENGRVQVVNYAVHPQPSI